MFSLEQLHLRDHVNSNENLKRALRYYRFMYIILCTRDEQLGPSKQSYASARPVDQSKSSETSSSLFSKNLASKYDFELADTRTPLYTIFAFFLKGYAESLEYARIKFLHCPGTTTRSANLLDMAAGKNSSSCSSYYTSKGFVAPTHSFDEHWQDLPSVFLQDIDPVVDEEVYISELRARGATGPHTHPMVVQVSRDILHLVATGTKRWKVLDAYLIFHVIVTVSFSRFSFGIKRRTENMHMPFQCY